MNQENSKQNKSNSLIVFSVKYSEFCLVFKRFFKKGAFLNSRRIDCIQINPHMHEIFFATLLHEMGPWDPTKGNDQLTR